MSQSESQQVAEYIHGETIEQRVAQFLNPVLQSCLSQRTTAGVAKYGKRLEENHQPERARVVHLIQELLDAAQYAAWLERWSMAAEMTAAANELQVEYGLSAHEIVSGGKQ